MKNMIIRRGKDEDENHLHVFFGSVFSWALLFCLAMKRLEKGNIRGK